jgi:predicted AlkP superfamily pyrophosphatase or phosphodiesterase
MGADFTGHLFGACSKEYARKAAEMDGILSTLLPVWLEKGYSIVVTADHGMNELGFHGGMGDLERLVPLWIIREGKVCTHPMDLIPQLEVPPMVCELLG